MTFNYSNENREVTIGHLEGIVRAMKRLHLEMRSLDDVPDWDTEKYSNVEGDYVTKQAEWQELLFSSLVNLVSHI